MKFHLRIIKSNILHIQMKVTNLNQGYLKIRLISKIYKINKWKLKILKKIWRMKNNMIKTLKERSIEMEGGTICMNREDKSN